MVDPQRSPDRRQLGVPQIATDSGGALIDSVSSLKNSFKSRTESRVSANPGWYGQRMAMGRCVVRVFTVVAVVSAVLTGVSRPASTSSDGLPLGPANLIETRSTTAIQPGVHLTVIVRGEPDPATTWTVEVAVPVSPDPSRPPTAIADREHADALVARLEGHGFTARVEEVTTPAVGDYSGGTLGFRVRIGRYANPADADAALSAVRAVGFIASRVFTGWDGAATDRGPWRLQVLTIDPHQFRGELIASYGPDLERRETTSALAAAAGATAAVNAGFFVLDPRAGAPGDPAGVGVYSGQLLSETTNGRPAFAFRDNGQGAAVRRLFWTGSVLGRYGQQLALDGINRVPGLIRNCGGTQDDLPTSHPLHDITCTDPDELIAFTPQYGALTPAGPGVEAVLDGSDTVLELRSPRGGPLPADGRSVQATGTTVEALHRLAIIGQRLQIRSQLTDGRTRHPSPSTMIVNGGPELVRDGQPHATPATDGMIRPGDPSFYYAWAAKRNPRTIAGVDRNGTIVLVTADGRSTSSLGLTIPESAAVAGALGMYDAINLDGGGSTTMYANGQVINTPSDATGERPVGDAILLLPTQ
jgi:Phosphodiester glycosidase/SPOR domain